MVNKLALLPFFLVVIPLVFYTFLIQIKYWSTILIPSIAIGMIINNEVVTNSLNADSVSTGPLVFVGDVLLARNVEFLMRTKGQEYPFTRVPELIGSNTSAVIGNFESAILEKHIKTPSFVTTFSVDKKYLPILHKSGFTHMSLANNHAFDYGSSTFEHTKISLNKAGMVPFGHPTEINEASHVIVMTGSTRVGILSINQVFTTSNLNELAVKIAALSNTTDYQIMYVHWGEEYMLKHNQAQETFAKQLIDFGADAIIGHHPHVVQDIDVYKEKPIFYSLGNFIFDQYFSVDVEQGLILKLSFINKEVHYELVPVSSERHNSQPERMQKDAQEQFLINLARRSHSVYTNNIKSGKLFLPFSLASYEQNGMIKQ